MIAEFHSTDPYYRPFDETFAFTISNDWWHSLSPFEDDDRSLKARRRRFQEFTRTLNREAAFQGIRPAAAKGGAKQGARAREQRDRRHANQSSK